MKNKRHIWTEDEVRLLRAHYETDAFLGELADTLGLKVSQVYQKAQALGLKKPLSYRSRAGAKGAQYPEARAHCFQKGHIPQNKGKKMPPEVYAKVARTMFKKGGTPVNHREVGSERVNVDGYVEIKVAEPNKWRLKSRVVWEQAYGEIPPGSNIQFKDHNPLNLSLDNLYIITRAEQMKTQNSLIARYPKELADVIRLRGSIKRQVTMYNKKQSKKEDE